MSVFLSYRLVTAFNGAMLVDSTNLEAQLPALLDAISKAEFVAFDTEFTGLRTAGAADQHQINLEDSNECRFQELRAPAQQFRVIQLGVCPFYRCPDSSSPRFEARRFSVMVYKSGDRGDVLLAEIGSLKFLSEHAFDFNRLISSGCDYSGNIHPEGPGEPRGLDRVLLALSSAGCPIVGHNCLRELMMMVCRST